MVENEEKIYRDYGNRVLLFGCLGLLPIIGFIFIILAIVYFVKDSKKGAKSIIGFVLALFFILSQFIWIIIAIGVLIQTQSALQSKALDVGRVFYNGFLRL